jgi:hypothetical protein
MKRTIDSNDRLAFGVLDLGGKFNVGIMMTLLLVLEKFYVDR